MGLLDWLGIGGGAAPQSPGLLGSYDPQAMRQQALFQALGATGAGLMAGGARRPVGQPGPGWGEAVGAFGPAYQRGLLGQHQQRALEQQAGREQAFSGMLGQVADPQQRALLAAVPPEQAATAMLTAQLRQGRQGTAAEHQAAGVPMGNLWFDQNGRPHLLNGPAVAGLTTAAQEAQRYRVVPPGGEVIGPPGGGGAMPAAAPPATPAMAPPRPMAAPQIQPGALPQDANPMGPPGEVIGQVPPSRPLAQARPSGATGGGQLQTIYRSSQPPPGSPERAFDTRYGAAQGDAAAGIHGAAQTAQQRLDEITQLRTAMQALREAGGTTGAGSPASQAATRALQALGVNPSTFGLPASAAPGEVVTAVANRLAMTMVGPGGLPANNFSEADRNFLVQSMPNLANRPEANEFLANVMERAAQRSIEMENRWIEARSQGQDYTTFLRGWRQYVSANPIISQQDRTAASRLLGGSSGGAAPPQGGQAAPQSTAPQVPAGVATGTVIRNPRTGERREWNGTEWRTLTPGLTPRGQ